MRRLGGWLLASCAVAATVSCSDGNGATDAANETIESFTAQLDDYTSLEHPELSDEDGMAEMTDRAGALLAEMRATHEALGEELEASDASAEQRRYHSLLDDWLTAQEEQHEGSLDCRAEVEAWVFALACIMELTAENGDRWQATADALSDFQALYPDGVIP